VLLVGLLAAAPTRYPLGLTHYQIPSWLARVGGYRMRWCDAVMREGGGVGRASVSAPF
jgi:hypothetical protein